jgi:hypothetical protein
VEETCEEKIKEKLMRKGMLLRTFLFSIVRYNLKLTERRLWFGENVV